MKSRQPAHACHSPPLPPPRYHRLQTTTRGPSLPNPRHIVAVILLTATTATAQVPDLSEARHLLDVNQLAAAESALRVILRATPSAADAQYLLGYTLFRESRPLDSLAAYTAAAALHPPTAADLTVVASDYILLKAFPNAERWLRLALTETPNDPHLWYLLGRTAYNQDHAADAAEAFQRCLALSPHDVRAGYNLGLTEEKLGHPDLARADYVDAIAWQADAPVKDSQPFLDLGLLDLHQDHPDLALPSLEQATRLNPANPLAFETLGLALDALHRPEEAIRALTTAATLAPTAERPHFFLGRIERRLGRTADSVEQFRIAQQLLGTHSDTATPDLDAHP